MGRAFDLEVLRWGQELRACRTPTPFEIEEEDGCITLVMGNNADWTYESLTFTREDENRYSVGYVALPDTARRTLERLRREDAPGLVSLLEFAVEQQQAAPVYPVIGFSYEANYGVAYEALEKLTRTMLGRDLL